MRTSILSAALVLFVGVSAYLAAGACVESVGGYSWRRYPTMELERGLDAIGVPVTVQLAVSNNQFTGRQVNELVFHPERLVTEADRKWLSTFKRAEMLGALWAVFAAVLTVLFIILGVSASAARARTRARRELARKTVVFPFGENVRRQINLARVPLPANAEPRGILLCGTPGTGKSQALLSVAVAARERNDTLVGVDRGGELVQGLYRKGDAIFCPLDRRSEPWSLLAEVGSDIDRDTLGELLFPQRGDGSPGDFFQAAAGVVFKAALTVCADGTNDQVWRTLSNKKVLIDALKGTAAEQYLEAREWGGIYGNLMNSLQWLKYLPPSAGRNASSIRQFIRESDDKLGRALWGIIPKAAAATLNPMAALLVGLVAHEALSLPPSDSRRIWLATDELGNLPMLSNFSTVMSEGRKHGLGPIAGMQSIAQLRIIYGRDGAQELMSCFQTWLILRQGDAESAESMSRHIGDKEVREWHQSEGASIGEGHSTSNRGRSEHVRVKRSVLARELQELPDRHGYLCLSPYPPAAVDLPLIDLPAVASRFEPLQALDEVAPPPAPLPVAPELDLGALSSKQELEH